MILKLQFFSEKGLEKQSDEALYKGIKSLEQRIQLHERKISSPETFYPEWSSLDEREKAGSVRHWEKEIANFRESIQNRIDELKKRGRW